MRKQRSLMKRCTVAVVSVSTVLPSIAPAMTALADELDKDVDSDESTAESADAKQEEDDDVAEEEVVKKATKSDADKKSDDELEVDEDGNPEDGDLKDDINASEAEEEPEQKLEDITLSGKDFNE